MKRKTTDNDAVTEGKIFAILSYLSIFCIIPLVFKKHNEFVLEHAKQGLIIFVGEVAVFIVHIILGTWLLRLGMFALGVLSFIGIIAVLKGETIKLPIVSEIAEKIVI